MRAGGLKIWVEMQTSGRPSLLHTLLADTPLQSVRNTQEPLPQLFSRKLLHHPHTKPAVLSFPRTQTDKAHLFHDVTQNDLRRSHRRCVARLRGMVADRRRMVIMPVSRPAKVRQHVSTCRLSSSLYGSTRLLQCNDAPMVNCCPHL